MALLNAEDRSSSELAGAYPVTAQTLFPFGLYRFELEHDQDIRMYYETYRRSADYYLDKYIGSMDRIAAFSSSWDTIGNPSNPPDGASAQTWKKE